MRRFLTSSIFMYRFYYPILPVRPYSCSTTSGSRASTVGEIQTNQKESGKICREDFDNARVPNLEEMMAMAANGALFGRDDGSESIMGMITSSLIDETWGWHVSFNGTVYPYYRNTDKGGGLWCVNR